MLRIGKVSDANEEKRTVRVFFEDVGIMSGWLKVLKNSPFIPAKNEPQKTEMASLHEHEIKISPWFPDIGEKVLCIYDSGFNADGYVLGGI